MIEDYEKKKRRQISLMRSLLDWGLGIMIVAFGIFLIIRIRFHIDFNERFPPSDVDKIFGVICIIYGGWRIYRGFRKDYFK
jgi:uncharacterized membrane protein YqjE